MKIAKEQIIQLQDKDLIKTNFELSWLFLQSCSRSGVLFVADA